MPGYLLTITSANEQAAVQKFLSACRLPLLCVLPRSPLTLCSALPLAVSSSSSIWMGNKDSTTEGAWKWERGPEQGQQHWVRSLAACIG